MTDQNPVSTTQPSVLHSVFEDYRSHKAANTLRRQDADLALFADFLASFNMRPVLSLAADANAWRGITWGLVMSFREWMLQQGYAVSSVNIRLSTVKAYARLAVQFGTLDATNYALMKTVTGYSDKEIKHIDEQRRTSGITTRIPKTGVKKAEHATINKERARRLKQVTDDSPQGRRDALLMSLLLDHGLRCGEVAALTVTGFNQMDGMMTFYRPKVGKVQMHRMSNDTRAALAAYINAGDCPQAADARILRGSRKDGSLTGAGMSERAITARVKALGESVGIARLSAHDCRHFWATTAARHKTDPFTLQEAGGWNSLAMPRRYVEAAKIANEGVNLGED